MAKVFEGLSDDDLVAAVPGARQYVPFNQPRSKARWVATVAGRSFGDCATMAKALSVAKAARIKELTARGLWRSDEFGELV